VPIFIGRGAPLCQLHVLHSRTKAAFARVPSARARPNLRDEQLAGDQPVQAREWCKYAIRLQDRRLVVVGIYRPITFAPRRSAILLCDFDMARVHPEFDKRRQAIVLSITSLNHKHATLAGLCTIVPTSSQQPRTIGPEDVLIPVGSYWSFDEDTWVRAKNITTVSHTRLSLLHYNGRPRSTEFLNDKDMARVELAVKHAMGIP
jgi:uncharacterized protein YifN (PemK superfamily)